MDDNIEFYLTQSENSELFKELELEFKFPYIDYELNLKGVYAIREYILRQIDEYKEVENELPSFLKNSSGVFNALLSKVDAFLERYNAVPQNLNSFWHKDVSTYIKQSTTGNQNTNRPFPFDCPETKFLIELNKQNDVAAEGAYNYIIGNQLAVAKKDHFFGAILAYEFMGKGSSDIASRRKKERASINNLKSEVKTYLGKSKEDFNTLKQALFEEYTKHSSEVDKLREDKKNEFELWFFGDPDSSDEESKPTLPDGFRLSC